MWKRFLFWVRHTLLGQPISAKSGGVGSQSRFVLPKVKFPKWGVIPALLASLIAGASIALAIIYLIPLVSNDHLDSNVPEVSTTPAPAGPCATVQDESGRQYYPLDCMQELSQEDCKPAFPYLWVLVPLILIVLALIWYVLKTKNTNKEKNP